MQKGEQSDRQARRKSLVPAAHIEGVLPETSTSINALLKRVSEHIKEQPGKTATFFRFDGNIAFIRADDLRRCEVAPLDFAAYLAQAETEFSGEGELIALRVRQLAGEVLSSTVRINLIAFASFPKDLGRRRTLMSLLSPDIPHEPPTDKAVTQLRADLELRGGGSLLVAFGEALLRANERLTQASSLEGYDLKGGGLTLSGPAREAVDSIMNDYIGSVAELFHGAQIIPAV